MRWAYPASDYTARVSAAAGWADHRRCSSRWWDPVRKLTELRGTKFNLISRNWLSSNLAISNTLAICRRISLRVRPGFRSRGPWFCGSDSADLSVHSAGDRDFLDAQRPGRGFGPRPPAFG